MPEQSPHFERERETLAEQAPAWREAGYTGKWFVLSGERSLGPFGTGRAAWAAGASEFGNEFMLERLRPSDEPLIVSHMCFHQDAASNK